MIRIFYKIILSLGFFILNSSFLFALIIEIKNIHEAEDMLSKVDEETLVIFDVHDVLITLKDKILQAGNKPLRHQLFKEHLKTSSIKPPENYQKLLKSRYYIQGKWDIVEPELRTFVGKIKEKKAKIIALTHAETGRLGIIPNNADFRINHVREFGIDFTDSFPGLKPKILIKSDNTAENAYYKDSFVFVSKNNKGPVLGLFLEYANWWPKKIIFFDNTYRNLISVQSLAEEKGIEFQGFHFVHALHASQTPDLAVATKQIKTLVDTQEWLSDVEASTSNLAG